MAQTYAVGLRIGLASKPDMANLGTALLLCIARAGVRVHGKVDADEAEEILGT